MAGSMRKSKDFKLSAAPERAAVININIDHTHFRPPEDLQNYYKRWTTNRKTGHSADRDELANAMTSALSSIAPLISKNTYIAIAQSGVSYFFDFLDDQDAALHPINSLADINKEILEKFCVWLIHKPAKTNSGRLAYTTARTIFSHLKTLLVSLIFSKKISMDCIPDNPFPNSNQARIGHQPYSKSEMQRLMAAIRADLSAIRSGDFCGTMSDTLIVYYLLLAIKTGRNPTPLFEMQRDSLQPHPLKPSTHALLTVYKKRANRSTVQSNKISNEVEESATITPDVLKIFNATLKLTEPLIPDAPHILKNRLWIFRAEHKKKGKSHISVLNNSNCHYSIEKFVKRHKLFGDAIDPLNGENEAFQLTTMRLRKTFATRIWHLTGGDIVRTSNALGNHPSVADTHYLAVTPEMVKNHHFLGRILEADLRNEKEDSPAVVKLAAEMQISTHEINKLIHGSNNTGVGRCSSPMYGKFAPKNGETICTAFLACFRCPNQVVMESDLYRLYSFYWMLIKERNLLGRNKWHKVYGWVIREIDQVISKKFSEAIVSSARTRAHKSPHPMWKERSALVGEKYA
jgi:hypothetical protein